METESSRKRDRNDSLHELEKEESPDLSSVVSMHEPFQSLDDPTVLSESMQALYSPGSRNFVLEFGDSHAHVAFDLDNSFFPDFLSSPRLEASSTRWINIWYPSHQRGVIETLAKHYDFSPRLLALMTSDPRRPGRRAAEDAEASPYAIASKQEHRLPDLESGNSSWSESPDFMSVASSDSDNRSGNLYDIVDEIWHYTSVDQGRSYLCLGSNSLYPLLNKQSATSQKARPMFSRDDHSSNDGKPGHQHPLHPHLKRVWTWLVLLNDRTVLTINEDLFPYAPHSASPGLPSTPLLTPAQETLLTVTRKNLHNIVRSLSTIPLHPSQSQSPMLLLPLRRRLGTTDAETAHRRTDAPGLLFYYLFENAANSYTLTSAQDHHYGTELRNIRQQMLQQPRLELVERLDRIGWELVALGRHYKSFLRAVGVVVKPQGVTVASLAGSRVASTQRFGDHDYGDGEGQEDDDSSAGKLTVLPSATSGAVFAAATHVPTKQAGQEDDPTVSVHSHHCKSPDAVVGSTLLDPQSLLGVSMGSAAKVRFERLRDMISLYALSEVSEYLGQKENLVQMVRHKTPPPPTPPPSSSSFRQKRTERTFADLMRPARTFNSWH